MVNMLLYIVKKQLHVQSMQPFRYGTVIHVHVKHFACYCSNWVDRYTLYSNVPTKPIFVNKSSLLFNQGQTIFGNVTNITLEKLTNF